MTDQQAESLIDKLAQTYGAGNDIKAWASFESDTYKIKFREAGIKEVIDTVVMPEDIFVTPFSTKVYVSELMDVIEEDTSDRIRPKDHYIFLPLQIEYNNPDQEAYTNIKEGFRVVEARLFAGNLELTLRPRKTQLGGLQKRILEYIQENIRIADDDT